MSFIIGLLMTSAFAQREEVGTAIDSAFDSGAPFIFRYQWSLCTGPYPPLLVEEIKVIEDYLQRHPDAMISIGYHTDYRDSETSNYELSLNRAENIKTWLVGNGGIAAERMVAEGYSESQPLVVSGEEAVKYPKFPAGTELSESYIKTLSPMWQEVANMLNCRYEVRFVR